MRHSAGTGGGFQYAEQLALQRPAIAGRSAPEPLSELVRHILDR